MILKFILEKRGCRNFEFMKLLQDAVWPEDYVKIAMSIRVT
jgi:hypothetical protein